MIYIEIESVISMLINLQLLTWIIPNKYTRYYDEIKYHKREMMATLT